MRKYNPPSYTASYNCCRPHDCLSDLSAPSAGEQLLLRGRARGAPTSHNDRGTAISRPLFWCCVISLSLSLLSFFVFFSGLFLGFDGSWTWRSVVWIKALCMKWRLKHIWVTDKWEIAANVLLYTSTYVRDNACPLIISTRILLCLMVW